MSRQYSLCHYGRRRGTCQHRALAGAFHGRTRDSVGQRLDDGWLVYGVLQRSAEVSIVWRIGQPASQLASADLMAVGRVLTLYSCGFTI